MSGKVDRLSEINKRDLYEVRATRKNVSENIDDIVAQVPRITYNQVSAAYDWHARRLRLVDAAIQQANLTTEIDVEESVMSDYVEAEGLIKK